MLFGKSKLYVKTAVGLSILVVLFTLYAVLVEPHVISLNVVDIVDHDLARIFHNKKVIQISDLHINSIGYREKKLIRMINQAMPDLLFITGDFLTNGRDEESCLEVLGQIKMPPYGIWAVLGNADSYKDDESNEKKTDS
jgi:predicted MPP superfamily phosphohydrolase